MTSRRPLVVLNGGYGELPALDIVQSPYAKMQKVLRSAATPKITGVMATAPTRTAGAANANGTINQSRTGGTTYQNVNPDAVYGPLIQPNDPRLTIQGGAQILKNNRYTGSWINAGASSKNAGRGWGPRFCTDTRYIEFVNCNAVAPNHWRLRVTDLTTGLCQWTQAADYVPPLTDYSFYYEKTDLGSQAPRRLEFFFDINNYYGGFNIDATANSWKDTQAGFVSGQMMGDSLSLGTPSQFSTLHAFLTPAYGDRLGIDSLIANGCGGSGLVAPGSGTNLITRRADLTQFGPLDLIPIAIGYNDRTTDTTALATLRAAAATYCKAVLQDQPDALLHMFMSTPGYAGGAVGQATYDAHKNGFNDAYAVASANDQLRMFYTDMSPSGPYSVAGQGPIFGTGNTSATNGSGNTDRYMTNIDTTHYNDGGAIYWGGNIAAGDLVAQMVARLATAGL